MATTPTRGPGRPARTDDERAEQRTMLLDAAMAAIRAHGPDVSVDAMAAEAGISKPVLYAAFGDKHGIGEAIAVELTERTERALIATYSDTGSLEMTTALRAGVNGFIDIVSDEPDIYRFIVRCIRTNDRGLLDNSLVRALQARFELVAELLAPEVDHDLLRVIAHATFGFMVAAVESWLVSRKPDRDELVESLVAVLTNGFRAAREQGPRN